MTEPWGSALKGVRGRRHSLVAAWEQFLGGGEIPPDAVRRLVEDSWLRCLRSGVSPNSRHAPLSVDANGLNGLHDRYAELVAAARPVMEHATQFLLESETVMVLTDPSGVVLWTEGDPSAKEHAEVIRLSPGAHWHESVAGTNAIGTTLALGQPVQIFAEEHFCEGIKHWACSATVIRDSLDQQILGVLDVSGLSSSHNEHCMALVVTCASRIEAHLSMIELEKRSRLLEVTGQRRWINDGVVVFDRRSRVVGVNYVAGNFLDAKGIDITDCLSITAALCKRHTDSGPVCRPDWIASDWLEPVIDNAERLGTLLVIPRAKVAPILYQPSAPRTADGHIDSPIDRIVGNSEAMNKARQKAKKLARIRSTVLILGPSGAGKEVFARAIHEEGPNKNGPFVPLNCGCMTRELLASELFGYAEGAFTGARRGGMAGKFEAADGGTLFLDEIGEMPLDLQPQLLRILEDGIVYRLGEHKPRGVKVRVIAATSRDLRSEISAGLFRPDLYYRLSVTMLTLPSLERRSEDILDLTLFFMQQVAARHRLPVKPVSRDVVAALEAYHWPGNVRELRNVVEHMVLFAEGNEVTLEDLPEEFDCTNFCMERPKRNDVDASLEQLPAGSLCESERAAIISAMRAENGNLTKTAARLGIAKSTLYAKLKSYQIGRNPNGVGFRDSNAG